MSSCCTLSLVCVLLQLTSTPLSVQPLDQELIAENEKLLRSVQVPTGGPALVQYFRRFTFGPGDHEEIKTLVVRLSDKSYKARELATTELAARGPVVVPFLKRQLQSTDLETQRRLERVIQSLEQQASLSVHSAAVQLLLARKPRGTCEALLAYLPHAPDAGLKDYILAELPGLAVEQCRVDQSVNRALRDVAPVRRAAAALILGINGNEEQRAGVRNLLKTDRDLTVRLHAAKGLLIARDPTPIPTLLEILKIGNAEQVLQADDLLRCVAGKTTPDVSLDTEAMTQHNLHAEWHTWWQLQQKIDLTKADLTLLSTSPAQQSRIIVRRFLRAILSRDWDLFRASSDVPFGCTNAGFFYTHENLQAFFGLSMHQTLCRMPVMYTIRLEQYPASTRVTDVVTKLGTVGLYVVPVSSGASSEKMEPGSAMLFVRVRGTHVRVVGMHRFYANVAH